jgi:allantoate deiminase
MAEEEGSRFPTVFWGSKNVVGEAKREEALFNMNFDKCFNVLTSSLLLPKIKALAMHLINKLFTFVVNSIVGQRRYTVNLKGQANHAGTTPMSYRHDAVYGFANSRHHVDCIGFRNDFAEC